ncbi:MAG: type II secretory pathway protein LspJ [uncultured bacterium]|nr:MAG: type II secretory pathway protein LspJ [uncultured bacterium]
MSKKGFTLLEILIALFIFTILSVMLIGALHSVINANQATDDNAERLRKTQMTLLLLSRDIEQAINRPIINATGKEEAAFIGEKNKMTFTHGGVADPTNKIGASSLRRVEYSWHDNTLFRSSWDALDQAPDATSSSRELLNNITEMHFQYLDADYRFQNSWPIQGKTNQALPKAVRVFLTIKNWGTMSQFYVITSEATSNAPRIPPKS